MRRRVVLITDGDEVARRTVAFVAACVGARFLARSAGNPTPLTGWQLVDAILQTPADPVLVLFDDCGDVLAGRGEQAMALLANHPAIEVLGALAVASNTCRTASVYVDCSVDYAGRVVPCGVDKNGVPHEDGDARVFGDTVGILGQLDVPLVVGIGDIGKMNGHDDVRRGAPITRKAVELILMRRGHHGGT